MLDEKELSETNEPEEIREEKDDEKEIRKARNYVTRKQFEEWHRFEHRCPVCKKFDSFFGGRCVKCGVWTDEQGRLHPREEEKDEWGDL